MALPTTVEKHGVIKGRRIRVLWRLLIEDDTGTMQDYGNFHGVDWRQSASWGANADQRIMDFEVRLMRSVGNLSLAPLVNNATQGANGPAIDGGRLLQVLTATVPPGTAPAAGDWQVGVTGYIEEVDWGGRQGDVVIRGQDATARLKGKMITELNTYGTEAGVPAEEVAQQILDTEFGAGEYTLYVPTPTGFNITEYTPFEVSVYDAIQNLMMQRGATIGTMWNPNTNSYSLTVIVPQRVAPVSVATLGPDDYTSVERVNVNTSRIRNRVRVRYRNRATGAAEWVEAFDEASALRYGEQSIYYTEAETSAIDTQAEAQTMANGILSDLSWPEAEQKITTLFWYPVEVGDVITWEVNQDLYTAAQDWAVTAWRHTLSKHDYSTEITTRGAPAAALGEWLRRGTLLNKGGTYGKAPSELEKVRLPGFDEVGRTLTTVTYGWEVPVANLREVWVKTRLVSVSAPMEAGGFWPKLTDPYDQRIGASTNTFTVDIPPAGHALYVTVEAYDNSGLLGEVYHVKVLDVGTPPGFEDFDQRQGASGEFTDLYVTIWDPQELGGTLYAWLNYDSPESADTTLAADATLAIASTPLEVTPVTPGWVGGPVANMFDNVRTHAGHGKQIVLEFINSKGVSSGKVAYTLTSKGGVLDAQGNIVNAGIKRIQQFAAGITPVEVVDTIGQATGTIAVTPDGKLYRKDSNGIWSAAVQAVDIAGELQTAQLAVGAVTEAILAANAVTTAKLAVAAVTEAVLSSGAVTTVKIANGAVTAGQIAALSIAAGHITAGAIVSEKLATGAILADHIGALQITAEKIAAAAITTAKIAAGAITANEIAVGTITADNLAVNSVIAGKIAAGAINASGIIVNGIITADHIAVSSLSAIDSNAGIIVGGVLESIDGRSYIDLNNTKGGNLFIRVANLGGNQFTVDFNGNAKFYGALEAATGTFTGTVRSSNVTLGNDGTSSRIWFEYGATNVAEISYNGVNLYFSRDGRFPGNLQVNGNVTVNTNLTVDGNITMKTHQVGVVVYSAAQPTAPVEGMIWVS